MARFWAWGVRNPALLLMAAGLLAGFSGVFESPLALAATAIGAVLASTAQHHVRRARRRALRAQQASETERAVQEIRRRYRDRHGSHRNAA